jgi:N6-adenosine-specific RNA methylase IME4
MQTLSQATEMLLNGVHANRNQGAKQSSTAVIAAKPEKALPPSMLREIELAQAGEWNLSRFAELVSTSETAQQQLREELIRLDFLMRPATEDEIAVCLGKLILHFPMTNMSEHEKTLLLGDYIAELGRFPVEIIAAVCREYCLKPESEFFPKAARLIAGCAGKFSVLARRRKTIAAVLEEGQRLKERRLSDAELKVMMERVRDIEIPQPSPEEKIAATVEAMRKSGAPEADIEAFKAGTHA